MTEQTMQVNHGTESENTSANFKQMVCFRLKNEVFGVDIAHVQEIIRMVEITKIPQAPSFVEGVVNLRGQIIPIIDLRTRFGFERLEEKEKDNRIVVVESMSVKVGLVVDAVTEVIRITSDQIDETPDITGNVEAKYIIGVATLDTGLLILLDTGKVFSTEEVAQIEEVGK